MKEHQGNLKIKEVGLAFRYAPESRTLAHPPALMVHTCDNVPAAPPIEPHIAAGYIMTHDVLENVFVEIEQFDGSSLGRLITTQCNDVSIFCDRGCGHQFTILLCVSLCNA